MENSLFLQMRILRVRKIVFVFELYSEKLKASLETGVAKEI